MNLLTTVSLSWAPRAAQHIHSQETRQIDAHSPRAALITQSNARARAAESRYLEPWPQVTFFS